MWKNRIIYFINFSKFYYKSLQVENKQGKKYSISICGGEKSCNGSAVCEGNNGYGTLANVIFDYGRDVIKLKYSNGSKCVNSKYITYILLNNNDYKSVMLLLLLY